RFDLAITMLNSLCHLLSLDDMVRHLAAVARHIEPDGLYIMELAHPADVLGAERRTSSEWSTETAAGRVSVRWGAQHQIDPLTQMPREHVSVTYHRRGGPVRTVTDVVPNRFWTATELAAAVRLAGGFTVAASYGDFETDLPVGAPGAWRMILVLCRDALSSDAMPCLRERSRMASPPWVGELPPSAPAPCADARSAGSGLMVTGGRRRAALAIGRCGKGGGGSHGTVASRRAAGVRRRTRACTACRLMPSASASERSGQPASVSAASVADSSSLRPEERSSRSRVATRSGSTGATRPARAHALAPAPVPVPAPAPRPPPALAPSPPGRPGWPSRWRACCTYCRSPFVTTSDMVRPSRASRALSRCRCSWSRRNVSSRLGPLAGPFGFISPRRGPGRARNQNRCRPARA